MVSTAAAVAVLVTMAAVAVEAKVAAGEGLGGWISPDEFKLVSQSMGLTRGWAVRAIKAVGNYGEVFERNLGRDSPLGIERGLNRLWTQGGLMYAPPVD